MKEQFPPLWIARLIESLVPPSVSEDILGDLDEMFAKDERAGNRYARRRYVINGLGFLFKRFFWKQKKQHQPQHFSMIGSYFKMAKRSLMSHKVTTSINILGLVIGIATSLLILSVIRFEKSFDTFHTSADKTYRLVWTTPDRSQLRPGISFPVPTAIREEVPELEIVTSVEYFGGANVEMVDSSGTTLRKFREETGFVFAAPEFFSVFDFKDTNFKWIAGTPKSLSQPFSIVLTRAIAKKYFGDDNPVGSTIQLQNKQDFTVTGIIEDLPSNTDFPFTVLVSYSSLFKMNNERQMNDWVSITDNHHTYVTVRPGASITTIEEKIAKAQARHTTKELSDNRHFLLQKLSDIHFASKVPTFTRRTISKETLLGLSAVAAFLLLTASINYINLATAQSSLRAKEVGLRKVMGSARSQVMVQYFAETFIIASLAALIAIIICQVLLYNLQGLLNMPSTQINLPDMNTCVTALGIVAVVTVVAGFYPAYVFSRMNPMVTLKGKFATNRIAGFNLRKVLVVSQFTLTQIMVVGTFIVVMQMQYFSNTDMGFDRDNIITARTPVRNLSLLKTMENRFRDQPFVSDVSLSYTLPGGVRRNGSYDDIGRPDASSMNDYRVFEYVSIDRSFLDLYKIKLLAGRNLTEADSSGNILINETLVKSLELGTPDEALGQKLKMGGDRHVTIVGVVSDYYSNSMKEAPDNIVMVMEPKFYSIVSIKLKALQNKETMQDAISTIDRIWSDTFPEYMFTYTFLDDNIAAYYAQEDRYAKLFQLFSFVLLAIGSLGLYGLISFAVNRKGKEIAIRKVLGATMSQILTLFTREYMLLIVLSFALAVPVSFYAINEWLSNFINHINLTWYLFAVPGLLVLILALIVILAKSLGAASSNPVDKLKHD